MRRDQAWEKQGAENTYRTPEEVLTVRERTIRIQQVMKKLPEQYRTNLLLREMNELSYKELCEVLDMNMSQVKVTLFRAKERLKAEMLQMKGDD